MVERHGIPWHEKAAGQLFCDRTARDIVDMLLAVPDSADEAAYVPPMDRAGYILRIREPADKDAERARFLRDMLKVKKLMAA